MRVASEEFIFLMVLVNNLLVALVYYFWNAVFAVSVKKKLKIRKRRATEAFLENRRTYLIRFIIMLLCPVIGPLFFLFSHLLYLAFFWSQVDLEDVIFSKERVKIQLKADEERERNVVPIEEAISLNDDKNLRTAMLNMLKGDIKESLASISLALNVEDSESSHYASSVLSDQLNDFRMKVQQLYQKAQADDSSAEYEKMMIDYMDGVLKQKVFSEIEQKRFVHMMEEAAERAYEKEPFSLTAQRYEGVALRLLEIKDYEKCEKWCLRMAEQRPDELPSYTCKLKLYFTTRNKAAFFETFEALKKSDVVIDNETLELIRLFS